MADLRLYDAELSELAKLRKDNCKTQILALRDVAAESRGESARQIAQLICAKIGVVVPDRMLTVCYLLDSIAQSVREPYRALFGERLVDTMGSAFARAPKDIRPHLLRLFAHWQERQVFSVETLASLMRRVNSSAAASAAASASAAGGAGGAATAGGGAGGAAAAGTGAGGGASAAAGGVGGSGGGGVPMRQVGGVGVKRERDASAGHAQPARHLSPPPRQPTPPPVAPAQVPLAPRGGGQVPVQQPAAGQRTTAQAQAQRQPQALQQPQPQALPTYRHLGKRPQTLSQLPTQMQQMRNTVIPLVGGPRASPETLRQADSLARMYEYVLGVEGDGAIIAGRATLSGELSELTAWRRAVVTTMQAQAHTKADEGMGASGSASARPAGEVGVGTGLLASTSGIGRAVRNFPPGPCAHVFELYETLAELDMLPLPRPRSARAQTGGVRRVVAPVPLRPFDRAVSVHRLYDGLPLQCALTGVRFAAGATKLLRAHTDRHFARAHRKPHGPPPSRPWFRPADVWADEFGTEQEHIAEAPKSLFGHDGGTAVTAQREGGRTRGEANADRGIAVPAPEGADLADLSCALSGEPLECFYDQEQEVWMVRDAVVLADGRLCHVQSQPGDAAVGTATEATAGAAVAPGTTGSPAIAVLAAQ